MGKMTDVCDLKHKELQEGRKKKSYSEGVMKYIGPSLLR